ncbi:MAG: SDR family oxidoreductase [Clostridia bacterium]|nr:SDR family oxidoreductase [Clostridia bacterium]
MENIVLITGASGTIGASIARLLNKKGYPLALHYHNNGEGAGRLASEFLPDGAPYITVCADVSDEKSVEAMFRDIERRLGKVSILINNAGLALPQKLFSTCTTAEYEAVFDVNVRGAMLCSKACIPSMTARRNGCIINIASIWGLVGASCEVIYSASKAALIGFTKSLAKELLPTEVRVNCIAPGLVLSEMNAHLSDEELAAACIEQLRGLPIPPNDVAEACAYLVEAKSVTGQVLSIDGGASL